jgi:hypothetical protein
MVNLEMNESEANSLYEAIEDRLEKLGADPEGIEEENERDRLLKLRSRLEAAIAAKRNTTAIK